VGLVLQKFLKYFGFLTLIFLAPSWSFASEPDLLSDLIKKMEIKSAKEFSYDSEFVSNESNQIIKSSGQVTLLPSLEAKWAQIQPTPKKTDATVKKGSFKGMEELGSADIFSIVSQIFLNFGEFAEAFPVQTIREKDGDIYAVLKGMPRTNIDEIIISYDHASAGVSLISLAFYDGHSGSLSFKPVLEKKLKVTSKERPRDEDRKLVDLGRLREIQSKLSANRYLTVDFEQTVYKSLRDRKRSSAGKAFFIKPDRFRWQLAKPTEKEYTMGSN
jgi:outer membrane lipoprotein-sorting protein